MVIILRMGGLEDYLLIAGCVLLEATSAQWLTKKNELNKRLGNTALAYWEFYKRKLKDVKCLWLVLSF